MGELDDYQMPDGYGTCIGKCLTFAEIEALLAAERERCAAVADKRADRWRSSVVGEGAEIIAREIRNLPPQPDAVPTPSATECGRTD